MLVAAGGLYILKHIHFFLEIVNMKKMLTLFFGSYFLIFEK